MKKSITTLSLALVTAFMLVSFVQGPGPSGHMKFPYKKAGLTEREAAAHLLSRFTFGARPGDVDAVVDMGLEKWFQQQLDANLPDDSVEAQLSAYDALGLTNTQIVQTYPAPAQVLRMAVKDGMVNKDSVKIDKPEYRSLLKDYMDSHGFKPLGDLQRQLINQKIVRAAYSNNQLREVLTDFWFNHFNVSLTKNDDRQFILTYERDAIRPHVLGRFEDLLVATAKSPAMLIYLDNFRSAGISKPTPQQQRRQARFMQQLAARQSGDSSMQQYDVVNKVKKAQQNQGLNENYAREIMELHTLGVDGGYTQSDVTQAARVLTGWTIYPMGEYGQVGAKALGTLGEERMKEQGFVHEGDFLFAANRHDRDEKKVLGVSFPAGGGYEEGVQLLHMLATSASTATFISRKLAVHFVSDNPPQTLIDKMAHTFLEKNGDIREVLITMVNAPEFWSADALREKTKSPFELAISTVRSLNARMDAPYQLYNWITKMGQQIYSYQAPTGFPDRGQYWINTGSLLNRMNFGLAIASGRIPGIHFNLTALNNNHEPESANAALLVYSKILLPERNVDETVKRLQPLLSDPELVKKVDQAAGNAPAARPSAPNAEMMEDQPRNNYFKPLRKNAANKLTTDRMQLATGNNSMLAQVVGIIIGSPEFQRK